jgi:hypothetical protein
MVLERLFQIISTTSCTPRVGVMALLLCAAHVISDVVQISCDRMPTFKQVSLLQCKCFDDEPDLYKDLQYHHMQIKTLIAPTNCCVAS